VDNVFKRLKSRVQANAARIRASGEPKKTKLGMMPVDPSGIGGAKAAAQALPTIIARGGKVLNVMKRSPYLAKARQLVAADMKASRAAHRAAGNRVIGSRSIDAARARDLKMADEFERAAKNIFGLGSKAARAKKARLLREAAKLRGGK